jgi:4-amino-4-deoxy-L-arabinose transferase-like glycosyltransferase
VVTRPRVLAALCLILGLLLLPRLALFAQFTSALLTWPWQFDYDEGVNLHAAWLLAHGANIYLPNPPDRFISAPYPPALYLLSAPLLLLGGIQLQGPRVLVLLATLAIAALLAYLVRREPAPWPVALLAAALWLCLSPVIIWAALYKQDMAGLAFGVAGLAAITRADGEPARAARWRGAALALFALAFFTKQSALAPAAAAVVWLILRDRRAGLRFAGMLLAALAGGLALLLAVSRGGFWQHAIVYQALPWLFDFWRRLASRLAGEYWPLLIWALAVCALALVEWAPRLRHTRERPAGVAPPLVAVYAAAALGSVMIQAGYVGANYNHLLDLCPPLIWLAGRGLARAAAAPGRAGAAALAAGGALLVAQVFSFGGLEHWYTAGLWPSATRDREMQGLSDQIRAAGGPLYAEDATLLLLNGQAPIYDDPATIALVSDSGAWDERRLVQDVRDRRFPLIIMRHGGWIWSRAAGAAFSDSYDLAFAGTLDVFRPRVYPLNPATTLDCDLGAPAELRLRGVSLSPGAADAGVAAGADLRVALYWRALRPPGDYATFVHLLDATGQTVAPRDNPHSATGQPTSAWLPGADRVEMTDLPLPASLRPGVYRLIAGVYSAAGGQVTSVPARCPDPARALGGAVDAGSVRVR